jgi:hypothetical protein
MKNETGFITVDFLFAIVLIMGLSSLMFVLSFTLSVASVTQYITYAAARNYVAAHIDEATQQQRAQLKYQALINNPVFKPLYANGWYKISAQANVGDHTRIIASYSQAAQGVNDFFGVGTDFVAAVLDFHIPFFGSTAPDSDGTGAGVKTYIGSYLGREPTEDECVRFTQARWDFIKKLSVSGGASYSTGTGSAVYYPMTDNGC